MVIFLNLYGLIVLFENVPGCCSGTLGSLDNVCSYCKELRDTPGNMSENIIHNTV